MLHGAQVFQIIGQVFSGSESQQLQDSLLVQSQQHLQYLNEKHYQTMKSTFDNEVKHGVWFETASFHQL